MFLLMVIVAVVMFDGLKQAHHPQFQDLAVFVYAMLFALFGFVALFRSHLRLAFFWIPNGKGKTNMPLYLHPRERRTGDSINPPRYMRHISRDAHFALVRVEKFMRKKARAQLLPACRGFWLGTQCSGARKKLRKTQGISRTLLRKETRHTFASRAKEIPIFT